MKTNRRIVFVSVAIIALLAFVSCDSKSSKKEKIAKITAQIDSLEALREIDAIKFYQKGHGEILAKAYEKYIDKSKDKALKAERLFLAAKEYHGAVRNPEKTIHLIKKLEKDYPEFDQMPAALFFLGFVYENDLKDLNHAEKYYKKVIKKYPGTHFAEQSEAALGLLGLTPEEVIKKFKESQPAE